jgi:hypothetical protein
LIALISNAHPVLEPATRSRRGARHKRHTRLG